MKLKICSSCGKECYLWKAKPPTCKSCSMKNATPIGSYTILTKTDTPKHKKKRNKRINPISEKEKKRLAEYRMVRDEWLKKNNRCEFPNCYSREVQLHHGIGRIGSLLTDIRHFHALCDTHHRWAELHPLEAKEMGLSGNRLDKEI